VLYYSLWFNAFKDRDAGVSKESLIKKIKELEDRVRELTAENEALRENKKSLEITVEELTAKLSALQDAHAKLLSTHEETVKELNALKSTYAADKKSLEARVSELSENIKLLKANSGDTVTQLQNAKDEITRERDALREELKNTREQLLREKKELEAKNAELQANLAKARKSIHALRKHLLQHVHDMHVRKVFLEQDREYESEDLHIVMENELEGMEFAEQVQTLDTAISEENVRLEKLLKEREAEAAEVVAVNIGKKKHRIKKGLEADHAAQKEAAEKGAQPQIGSRPAAAPAAGGSPAGKKK